MATAKKLKKWFMLQMWRLQQVAQVLTLVLLALNLALQVFGLIKWRTGSPLSISYVGVPMIMLLLVMIIWTFAIFWDLRLKMWRDQMNVAVERNPYSKERLSSKEVFIYALCYLPVIERLGKDDPKLREVAEVLKKWFKKETEDDPQLVKDVKEIFDHIGSDKVDLIESLKKAQ